MNKKWTAGPEDKGKRLDVFLTDKIEHVTRSAISKLLKNGAGKINGKQASVHAFLKEGDQITLETVISSNGSQTETARPLPKLKDLGYL